MRQWAEAGEWKVPGRVHGGVVLLGGESLQALRGALPDLLQLGHLPDLSDRQPAPVALPGQLPRLPVPDPQPLQRLPQLVQNLPLSSSLHLLQLKLPVRPSSQEMCGFVSESVLCQGRRVRGLWGGLCEVCCGRQQECVQLVCGWQAAAVWGVCK